LISALTDKGPYEFAVSGAGGEYIDLANTYLFVEAQIVADDDTALDAGADVGPVNLRMHSLFSDVSVSLNEKLVSPPTSLYPYIRMSWGVQVPFLSENIIRCVPLLSLATSGLFSPGRSFNSSLSGLRIVPVEGRDGEMITRVFDPIQYCPLLQRQRILSRMKPTHHRDTKAYHDYYIHQAREGYPVFAGRRYLRGHGLGSIFGGLFKAAMTLLKKGAKTLGREALKRD
jgi:hypothetical protein